MSSSQRDRVYGEDEFVLMEKERVEEIMICALYPEKHQSLPPAAMENLLHFCWYSISIKAVFENIKLKLEEIEEKLEEISKLELELAEFKNVKLELEKLSKSKEELEKELEKFGDEIKKMGGKILKATERDKGG